MNLFHHALRVWAQHREFRAVYAELARHSDHELRDMGIDRGDIARIAYDEAERRIVTPVAARPVVPVAAYRDADLVPGR